MISQHDQVIYQDALKHFAFALAHQPSYLPDDGDRLLVGELISDAKFLAEALCDELGVKHP